MHAELRAHLLTQHARFLRRHTSAVSRALTARERRILRTRQLGHVTRLNNGWFVTRIGTGHGQANGSQPIDGPPQPVYRRDPMVDE